MCDLLSAWLNIKTNEVTCLSLTSHRHTQEAIGWKSRDLQYQREWEWLAKDDKPVVRTAPNDEHPASWYVAELLARWPKRIDAINACVKMANGGWLDLSSLTSAEGLVLPESVGGSLYLGSLSSANGLVLPKSVGGSLDLSSLTSAEGLVLPQIVGDSLYLSGLTSAEGLVLPKLGGGLWLKGGPQ